MKLGKKPVSTRGPKANKLENIKGAPGAQSGEPSYARDSAEARPSHGEAEGREERREKRKGRRPTQDDDQQEGGNAKGREGRHARATCEGRSGERPTGAGKPTRPPGKPRGYSTVRPGKRRQGKSAATEGGARSVHEEAEWWSSRGLGGARRPTKLARRRRREGAAPVPMSTVVGGPSRPARVDAGGIACAISRSTARLAQGGPPVGPGAVAACRQRAPSPPPLGRRSFRVRALRGVAADPSRTAAPSILGRRAVSPSRVRWRSRAGRGGGAAYALP